MRTITLVIAGMLAVSAAFPAMAAKKQAASAATVNSFEQCESRALAQGLVHGQAGHHEFVSECMGAGPASGGSTR